jgi:hypothetical protein
MLIQRPQETSLLQSSFMEIGITKHCTCGPSRYWVVKRIKLWKFNEKEVADEIGNVNQQE